MSGDISQVPTEQLMQMLQQHQPSLGDRILSSGINGMRQGGPLMAYAGAMGEFSKPAEQALNRAAYRTGGWATDQAAKYFSPETAAKIGSVTNYLTETAPSLLAGPPVKGATEQAAKGMSRFLMQSALKPSKAEMKSGEGPRAIATALREGINPNEGGVAKLKSALGDVHEEVQGKIAGSTGEVPLDPIGQKYLSQYDRALSQANPDADLGAVQDVWHQFSSHPAVAGSDSMSVQLAHEMKRGTQRAMRDKYGEQGNASTEAQKALARYLREGVAEAEPSVVEPLKREADLANALPIVKNRAVMENNKNPIGIGAALATPWMLPVWMWDRSAVAKAMTARALNASGPYAGSAASAAPALGYNMVQQANQ